MFEKKPYLTSHQINSCRRHTKEVYVGNVFSPSKSVFSILQSRYDIKLTETPTNHHFAIFDFEAALMNVQETKENGPTAYTKTHVPLSFSIFSNVSGFDQSPFTVVSDGNTRELIGKFVSYLNRISEAS